MAKKRNTNLVVSKKPAKASKPWFEFVGALTPKESRVFKYCFIAVAVLIFLIRPMFSSRFGPSGDELSHKALGDLSYDFLTSFGKNDSVFRYVPNASQHENASLMLNYGPLLEVAAAAIYKNTGANPYIVRHLLLTVFTFLLFYYCGMAAYKIAGWRAGLMAMLFMLVSPRILGEAFNNPKDPPFAAGYIMAVYGLLCLVSELPKPRWQTVVLTMVGIGLALSIRVGGLLLFPYTILFVGFALLLNEEWRGRLFRFDFAYYGPLIGRLIVLFAGAWLIGIMAWPAALRHPFTQPLQALAVQSSYPTVISVLFDGKVIGSNEVPWNYNPYYLTATSPVIVMCGFFVGLLLLPYLRKVFNGYSLFMILFVSLFPLFYIIYKKSALLNGWRHSYFTYTGIVVFSAVSFEGLLRIVKARWWNYVLYGALAVGIAFPAVFIVKNFPVVYVYFNKLAGGVDGTYGDYNLDYYACSAKPAADWMAKNISYNANIKVVSNNPGELNESFKMDNSNWQSSYIRYRERNEQDWDYAVFLPQFVDPDMMKNGKFAPKGTIHKIMVDNSVVAVVVKRESKDDFVGITALKNGDVTTAVAHLESAVKQDGDNEIAWAYLGLAYAMQSRKYDAIKALNKSLSISPGYLLAKTNLANLTQMRNPVIKI